MSLEQKFKVGDKVIDLVNHPLYGIGTIVATSHIFSEYVISFEVFHKNTPLNSACRSYDYPSLVAWTPLMEALL